ncbi:deoxynucleoside kinase [Candidatus Gracilibacteria bacterium]|nr:deoxynucleoside kinase [Candidatus Gracilibacteria bacterium]
MFIVLDGLDGSGKGTQTKLVSEALIAMGKKVLVLDYPRYGENSTYFAEKYLNGAYGEVNAKAASIFYALDRFDDSFNFKERQKEYDYIISNRYVSANMMHHGGKIDDKKKRMKFMKWLYKLEYKIFGIPKPDLVLFLDVPPEVSQSLVEKKEKREYIKDGKTKDLHEADEHHLKNAYKVAHEILETFPDWKAIKCTKDRVMLPEDTITQKILSHITK